MSWEELVRYCIEHRNSIYVRYGELNLPLAEIRFADAITFINGWHVRGMVPHRVLKAGEGVDSDIDRGES